MKSNLEDLVPGLADARRRERLNRALAFAGVTHTICGVELLAMTPGHRLALQLLGNAFVSRATPLEGDVFTFLWVLSSSYSRRITPASTVRQFFLRRRVRRIKAAGRLGAAISQIREYVVAQYQDFPEDSAGEEGGGERIDHSPWVHWAASDASWWMNKHGGFTRAEYFATPYSVLQQLYRGWQINNPEVTVDRDGKVSVSEPQFINGSDGLVGRWHQSQRAAITAAILANPYRRE